MPESARKILAVPITESLCRLRGVISSVQHSEPYRAVTVVSPSSFALRSLRHELGDKGLFNVRFMPLSRIAELIAAPTLNRKDLVPLNPVVRSSILH